MGCGNVKLKNCKSIKESDLKKLSADLKRQVVEYYSMGNPQNKVKKIKFDSCSEDSIIKINTITKLGFKGEFTFNWQGKLINTIHYLPEVY